VNRQLELLPVPAFTAEGQQVWSFARSINSEGVITGSIQGLQGTPSIALRWSPDGAVSEIVTDGLETKGISIDNGGSVLINGYFDGGYSRGPARVGRDGNTVVLPVPSELFGGAPATTMSRTGIVAGYCYGSDNERGFFIQAVAWPNDEFTRLVKTYPESAKIPDAYVLIGEYWFEENQAYKALTAYQKAAAFKNHDKYAFANYKLAWCYFNVGDPEKAIVTMKSVVAFSMSDTTGNKSNLQLQDEALKDLVRFFADAGAMDEAYKYFNGLGKKDLIRDMLKRLAGMYVEQGKLEDAILTYRRLISDAPEGSNAPEYQDEIVKAFQKMGRKEEHRARVSRLGRQH
jgi:hypothetical protein